MRSPLLRRVWRRVEGCLKRAGLTLRMQPSAVCRIQMDSCGERFYRNAPRQPERQVLLLL
jgi:hypothetical protein